MRLRRRVAYVRMRCASVFWTRTAMRWQRRMERAEPVSYTHLIVQPDVQDAAQTTLELLLSILNFDFIRKDIEFVRIYKEILYASEGMLKYWYRTGNYDVTAFEQEYLEMINHWEIVYGKGIENDRKQMCIRDRREREPKSFLPCTPVCSLR